MRFDVVAVLNGEFKLIKDAFMKGGMKVTEHQKINWKRSGDIPVLQDVSKGTLHMLQFPLLEQQSWISHGFSTTEWEASAKAVMHR